MKVKDFIDELNFLISNDYITEDNELFIICNDGNGWKVKDLVNFVMPKFDKYIVRLDTGIVNICFANEKRLEYFSPPAGIGIDKHLNKNKK